MKLPGDDQARMVAIYMIHSQMEAVVAKTMADEAKRRNGE